MKRYHLFISGIVQGVGFRWYVEKIARANGLYGHVRNLPDGRVEIVAEGNEYALDLFVSTLKEGRLGKNISSIERHEEPATGSYEDFRIAF